MPKFYRKGKEFYEEGTNRYIGPTEFGKGAGFTETSAPGDLSGTMTEGSSLLPQSTSDTMAQFGTMRNLLNDMTRRAYDQRPSIKNVVDQFKSQVGAAQGAMNPNIVGGVINRETQNRTRPLEDIFRNTMNTIQTMEKIRLEQQQNANNLLGNLASAGLLNTLTGDEFNQIMQTGVLPLETLQKISTAVQQQQQSDTKYQFVPQTENQQAGSFNLSTGQFTPFQIDSNMPAVGSTVQTALGQATITSYGSDYWDKGLDLFLGGGNKAAVKSPFRFKVKQVLKENQSGGFGNQVQVIDEQGNEIWFSHLDKVNMLSKDRWFDPGTVVGTQGNTGKVIDMGGGGYHVDVTMKDVQGNYLSPQQVAQYLGISGGERKSYTDEDMATAREMMKPFSTRTLTGVPQKQRAGVEAALNELKEEALKSGDIYGVMKASAGGAKVDGTTVKDLAKYGTSLDQLNDLKKEIDAFKAKGGTGAFKGRINEQKFWDADVATIKAKLIGVVPTIARGVFGEVGVLTDTDINTYKQTIPDIKTPNEAIDRILQGIMGTIESRILNTYESYANAGYDVSGYADTYKKLQDKIAQMKTQQQTQSGTTSSGLNYNIEY